jgi:protein TonB
MDADKILNSDPLDVLFDHRNKEYGAYQLRKGYNKRFLISLSSAAIITGTLFGANYLNQHTGGRTKQAMTVVDIQLEAVKEEKLTEPAPPPPPPPTATIQRVEITRFTPPKIVKDNEVKEEEKPPEQQKLEDTRIGAINQEGVKDEGVVAPPITGDGGKGIVEAPTTRDAGDYNQVFNRRSGRGGIASGGHQGNQAER